ncbi:prolyl oligopeptidase family serine peptidase [Shewanella sp. A3A]|nr:prolyl oligopeptidase family serine peptidase [Shewanella ferrihydritica]
MSKKVAILLHGVGSNGADMAPLASHWQQQVKDVLWLTPNAPFHSDMGNGYQWFSLQGITNANRPERIAAARSAFDAQLNTLFSQYDIDPQLDRVVLVGFSQGAMMSLDALVSARYPLTGVVAFSGRLASPTPYQIKQAVPVLLVHGLSDPVVPHTESASAATALTALGHKVSSQFEPGITHTISASGVTAAASFIKHCFE